KADIYIGEISLVSNVSTAANDGIVWKASTHTGYYSQGPSGSTTYLDGKMVAKFKLSESGPGNNKVFLNFKTLNNNTVVDVNSVKTAWTNAGYSKVLVTCYIPSDVLSDSSKERESKTVLFNSDTNITVYQQRFVGFDEWYTFVMTIDQFWSRYNSSYNYMTLFGAYNSNIANATPAEYYDENFTIYFDSIRLA
ncbi:MAG: hypothetical protein IJ800_00915, partial [Clostridia bacterium]|nr:hypothetical protein [Clostridia bacterium]